MVVDVGLLWKNSKLTHLPAARNAGEGANPMAETAIKRTRRSDLNIIKKDVGV